MIGPEHEEHIQPSRPEELDIDEEELARQRKRLEAQSQGRSALVIEPQTTVASELRIPRSGIPGLSVPMIK